MPLPSIAYHLHDSVLASARLENEDRLVLNIELYPIYYPEEPCIQLILSGISNQKEAAAFQREVDTHARKRARLGYRIDEFNYTPDSSGKDNQVSLYLAVDHLPPLRIQCKKYHFAKGSE
jgi:hypothetical protein